MNAYSEREQDEINELSEKFVYLVQAIDGASPRALKVVAQQLQQCADNMALDAGLRRGYRALAPVARRLSK